GLLETDGQVGADPGVAVQHPAQGYAGDPEPGGGLADAETEVGQDVLAQDLTGVDRVLHRHWSSFPSLVVVLVVDEFDVGVDEPERHAPVAVDPDRVVPGKVAFESVGSKGRDGQVFSALCDVQGGEDAKQLGDV